MMEFKLEPKSFGPRNKFRVPYIVLGKTYHEYKKHLVEKRFWSEINRTKKRFCVLRNFCVQRSIESKKNLLSGENFGHVPDSFRICSRHFPNAFQIPSRHLLNLHYNLRSTLQHPLYIQDSE